MNSCGFDSYRMTIQLPMAPTVWSRRFPQKEESTLGWTKTLT
jgi:hypothetical protein